MGLQLSDFVALYAKHPQISHIKKWLQSRNLLSIVQDYQAFRTCTCCRFVSNPKNSVHASFIKRCDSAAILPRFDTYIGTDNVFFPSSYKSNTRKEQNPANEILRTETLTNQYTGSHNCRTYPQAQPKKLYRPTLQAMLLKLAKHNARHWKISIFLAKQGLQSRFCLRTGQFSIRGSIFRNFLLYEYPTRMTFLAMT